MPFTVLFLASESDCLQILLSHGTWCNTRVETVSVAADSVPSVNGYTRLSEISSGIILSFILLTLDTLRETNCFISMEKELCFGMEMHFSA